MFWNIGITRNNENKLLILSGVMLSVMLLPAFRVVSGLPSIRVDEVLLFGVYGINILYYIIHLFKLNVHELEMLRRERKALRAIRQVFAALVGVIIISNIYGVIFLGGKYSVRDAMEFITIIKYYLVLTLVISIDIQEQEYRILKWVMITGFVLNELLAWGQHLNPANFNSVISPFFDPSHWDTLIYGNPVRILGPFDNPNVMGMFCVILLAVFTTRFYFKHDDLKRSLLVFVLCGLVLKMTFLTISRTSFLGTATVLAFLSLRALFRLHWRKDILIKIGALFVLTLVLYFTSSRGVSMRIKDALNFNESTSAQGHLKQLGSAFLYIKDSPILGWGTAKATMTTVVDNEYALVMRRYGILGLLIYLWLFIRPLILSFKYVRNQNRFNDVRDIGTTGLLAIAFSVATMGVFIYNLTAGIFYNLQLMTFYAILMGLIYRTERETV